MLKPTVSLVFRAFCVSVAQMVFEMLMVFGRIKVLARR